jgi:hypothetical protein
MSIVTANPSTAQTNTNLVAAVTDRSFVIRGLYISSDTAMTVSIENAATNATLLWRQYVAANGGVVIGGTPGFELARTISGEGIDYSTSAAGNVFVAIMYDQA